MPRPKKTVTAEVVQEEKKSDGLIALEHFAKKGKLFIGGESYEIVDGVVMVKPKHYAQAQEHIKLIGG
jgi:predicted house-cleaning NTP pyrophosphatase (Maf/HAM1 superfamily)